MKFNLIFTFHQTPGLASDPLAPLGTRINRGISTNLHIIQKVKEKLTILIILCVVIGKVAEVFEC